MANIVISGTVMGIESGARVDDMALGKARGVPLLNAQDQTSPP